MSKIEQKLIEIEYDDKFNTYHSFCKWQQGQRTVSNIIRGTTIQTPIGDLHYVVPI